MSQFRPLSETKFINDANLVSYWKLDGNSNDSKGSNNGTDTSISYVTGQFGQCAEFNATGDYITIPSINFGSGDFTISFWYNPSSTVNNARLWDQYDNPREFKIFQLPSSSEALRIASYNGSTEVFTSIPTSVISTGTWHYVTVVKSSDNCNAYVNGKYIATSTGWTGRTHSGATACGFGGINQISVLMKLDDAAIFSRALSSSEVNELYQGMTYGEYLGAGSTTTKLLLHLNGNSTDSSGNNNNGTDTAITYVDGKFGKCASFNGSTSKIDLGTALRIERTQAWTFNAWIKTSTATGYGPIYSTQENSGSYRGITIWSVTNVGPKLFATIGNTTGSIEVYGGTTVTDNAWRMITVTYDGSSNASGVNLYVDGKLETKTTQSNTLSTSIIGVSNVFVGSRASGLFYNGLIDELPLEYRVWTSQEVAKYYTYAKGRFGIL